jgi:nitrate/nitrite transport system ATP-binding protein
VITSQEDRLPVLQLIDLGKAYRTPGGTAEIVSNFCLSIYEGEYVSLLGHSGCGKSTVLSMVAGLISPTAGSIETSRGKAEGTAVDSAMVFQKPCLLPWLTAFQNVMLALAQLPGLLRGQREQIAYANLALVGLAEAADKRPAQLSQGMQQRVGLARAFSLSPRLLLLDEPFGMLDGLTRIELQEALIEILDQKVTSTLMVTHDVDEAIMLSDRIVLMTNGPGAFVGRILDVPFPRPRIREELLSLQEYYHLRAELIDFLEHEMKKERVRQ